MQPLMRRLSRPLYCAPERKGSFLHLRRPMPWQFWKRFPLERRTPLLLIFPAGGIKIWRPISTNLEFNRNIHE